jgi:hypothetical protein
MQWQKIETHPKDASWFMVCVCHTDYTGTYVGGKPLIVFYDGVNLITHGGMQLCSEGYYSPTHWMQLPPPPTED